MWRRAEALTPAPVTFKEENDSMRILLLSDIHANIAALRAVEQDAGRVDAVYCAGDCVDYGTDPHEAIAWLRDHGARCVAGNHDRHLLSVLVRGETQAFRGTRNFKWVHDNCERITEADAAYLRALPTHLRFTADGAEYLMQHQMRDERYDMPESVQEFNAYWREHGAGETQGRERRLIFGHTHRRCVHVLDEGMLWLNPGSASYRRPDDSDKRAHYMLLEEGAIRIRAVPYDRGAMLARTLAYVRAGTMLETDLQDAMFFFGDAETARSPLPKTGEQTL